MSFSMLDYKKLAYIFLLWYDWNVLYAHAYVSCWWCWSHFVWQSHIFLLNCDVCCSFPLPEMLGNFFSEIDYKFSSRSNSWCWFLFSILIVSYAGVSMQNSNFEPSLTYLNFYMAGGTTNCYLIHLCLQMLTEDMVRWEQY